MEKKGIVYSNVIHIQVGRCPCLQLIDFITFPQNKTKKEKKEKKPEALTAGDKMHDCPKYQRFLLDQRAKIMG